MKKMMAGLMGIAVVVMAGSCRFEVPETATIKGTPGLSIPLGSPFAGENNISLSEYLSADKIREMMGSGEGSHAVELVDYKAKTEVQTYLVHYPIADMNLDLTKYVQDLDIVPLLNNGISSDYVPGLGRYTPEAPVLLDDMSEWILDVTGAVLYVDISFKGQPSNDVKVRFNIRSKNGTETKFNKEVSGTPSGGKLRFATELFKLEPKKDSITISINAPLGTEYKPELDFKWDTATVKPGDDGKFTGNYPLSFSDLLKFLGEGVELKKASGYLYLAGLPPGSTKSFNFKGGVTRDISSNVVEAPSSWKGDTGKKKTAEDGGTISFPSEIKRIDLRDVLREEGVFLAYEIDIGAGNTGMSITPGSNTSHIQVDMIIELPLEFSVNNPTENFPHYVKLELEALQGLNDRGDDADLFDPELFGDLEYVKIYFNNIQNTISKDDMYVGLVVGKAVKDPIHLQDGTQAPPIEFTDIPRPFSPKIEVLIKKEPGKETGTFTVKPQDPEGEGSAIDLSIAIEAKVKLEQTITFGGSK